MLVPSLVLHGLAAAVWPLQDVPYSGLLSYGVNFCIFRIYTKNTKIGKNLQSFYRSFACGNKKYQNLKIALCAMCACMNVRKYI